MLRPLTEKAKTLIERWIAVMSRPENKDRWTCGALGSIDRMGNVKLCALGAILYDLREEEQYRFIRSPSIPTRVRVLRDRQEAELSDRFGFAERHELPPGLVGRVVDANDLSDNGYEPAIALLKSVLEAGEYADVKFEDL